MVQLKYRILRWSPSEQGRPGDRGTLHMPPEGGLGASGETRVQCVSMIVEKMMKQQMCKAHVVSEHQPDMGRGQAQVNWTQGLMGLVEVKIQRMEKS